MRLGQLFLLSCVLAAACIDREESPLPLDASGVRALILVKVEEGRVQEASAYDADGVNIPVDISTGSLIALAYDHSLEELGLGAGVLERAPSGAIARTLPRSANTFRADANPGGPLDWVRSESVPEELLGFLIPGSPTPIEPCPDFELIEMCTGNRAWVSVAEPLDESRIFFANEESQFFIATSSTIALIPSLPEEEELADNASYTLPDGRILLACTINDPLTVVDPSDGWSVDSPGPCSASHTGDPTSLVRLEGEGETLFGASRGGQLVTIKDRRARPIGSVPKTLLFDFLTYLGNDEAIITISETEFYWWKDGALEAAEPVWTEQSPRPTIFRAARHPRGFMLAALSERGGINDFILFDRESSSWYIVARNTFSSQIHDIQMFEDGFLYAGRNAALGFYSPRTGFCAVPVEDTSKVVNLCDEPYRESSRSALGFYGIRVLNPDLYFVAGWNTGGVEQLDRVWFVRRL